MVLSSIRRSYALLTVSLRKRGVLSVILLLVNSFLDLLGLAVIIPLFGITLKEDFAQQFPVVSAFFSFLNLSTHFQIAIALVIFSLIFILIKNIAGAYIHKIQIDYIYDIFLYLTSKLYKSYSELDFLTFHSQGSNVIQREITHVPRMFSMMMLTPLFTVVNEAIVLGLILVGVLLINYQVLLVLIITVLPFYFVLYRVFKDRIQSIDHQINELVPLASKSVFDMIFGYVDSKLTGAQNFFEQKFNLINQQEAKLRIKQTLYIISLPRLVEVSMMLSFGVLLSYGVISNLNPDDMVVLFGVFGMASFRAIPSINRILSSLVHIRGKQYTLDSLESMKTKIDHNGWRNLEFQEAIEFRSVSFEYPDKEQKTLSGIDMVLEKGQVVGLIGESGSGKTTLLNLILGFLRPVSGKILVDGVDLLEIRRESWWSQIGYIKQDPFIMDASIFENVTLSSEEIDIGRMNDVLLKSQLESFVNSLAYSGDYVVGDRGARLSGGQKQRIAIARAMYHGASILIMDEPTSALDSKTESEFSEVIGHLKSMGFTIVVVSHRTQALQYCDQTYVLESGKISKRR